MFDSLTKNLTTAFDRLMRSGSIREDDINQVLREIRVALLEADVNLSVIKELLDKVRDRSLQSQTTHRLNLGQQIIRIIYEELKEVLGSGHRALIPSSRRPSVALVVGLQGAGKTTTVAKLGLRLQQEGHKVLLIAADINRPAAVEQLDILGRKAGIPVYKGEGIPVTQIVRNGLAYAADMDIMWVVIDTGGRLHIDENLMAEMADVKNIAAPAEILLTVDSMSGQDAVQSAQEFHKLINLTGLIITKLDGDTRGGASISISHATGVPVKFVGVGEGLEALEEFHPDRMASRILGMGDVATLAEKAQREFDQGQAKDLERKIRRQEFNLEDFSDQLQKLKRMGPFSKIMEMIPGGLSLNSRVAEDETPENRLDKIEAMISSMTFLERRNPDILNGSRKKRISLGSGTTVQEVNQVLHQYKQMQKLMKRMSSGRGFRDIFKSLG